ncbi:MAG: phosphoserine phosphatase SerB [Oligoflexales bacterium]
MKNKYLVFVEEENARSLEQFAPDIERVSHAMLRTRLDLTDEEFKALRATFASLQRDKRSCGIIPVNSLPVKALFFDMDSTAIEQETINELAVLAGKSAEISRITEEAMKGNLSFPEALRARLSMLTGLESSSLQTVAAKVTISKGMETLCTAAHRNGAKVFLISGGFNEIAQRIAKELAMDGFRAHQLEFKDEKLSGNLASPLIDSAAKASYLLETCKRLGISRAHAVGVGDGANDIAMLDAAGIALGFTPKETLIPHIDFANYRGDHSLFCDILSFK